MTTPEERKEKLEQVLKEYFEFKVINDIPNIDGPLLLIFGYSPSNRDLSLVSFAFSLLGYYKGCNSKFSEKFWITEKNTKNPDSENTPNYHQDYNEFYYGNYHFYPFSAKFDGDYDFLKIESMQKLLRNIYSVIIFDQ